MSHRAAIVPGTSELQLPSNLVLSLSRVEAA